MMTTVEGRGMEQVTQQFQSDLRQLGAVRALIRDVCGRAWGVGTEEEQIAQLELAVDEAAANVILHAYRGEAGLPVEVVVTGEPEQVCVLLFHQGEPFDPSVVAPPAFDGSRESGFGLYLIRQAVDELMFFQDERGRHGIRLVKKRTKHLPEP
jgi:anti-sigma regulatory factor (Ser/Thr protein kinase)